MAVISPSTFDAKTNLYTEVKVIASSTWDHAYVSKLTISPGGGLNHMLTLNLRIFLDKFMPPANLKKWIYLDADNNPFIVGPWSQTEWLRFTKAFLKQCDMWNNQFWLIPPADFSALDIKTGGTTIRPNVYCNVKVDIVGGAADAHRTIKVVNLDAKSAAAAAGKKESDIGSGHFRSHMGLYDTFDVRGRDDITTDETGTLVLLRHYTVAHEIGHALGQPHIGQIKHDRLCDLAILLDRAAGATAFQQAIPAMFSGGSNSGVCYGDFGPASSAFNVMGGGESFEAANAQPWLDVIPYHMLTKTPWTVNMGKIPPKLVP